MPKFRKKPVVIEAVHYDLYRQNRPINWLSSNPQWLQDAYEDGKIFNIGRDSDNLPRELKIKTLEGEMLVSRGDWIIRGVRGEIYPCKPDIFLAIYEPVTDGEENPDAVIGEKREAKS